MRSCIILAASLWLALLGVVQSQSPTPAFALRGSAKSFETALLSRNLQTDKQKAKDVGQEGDHRPWVQPQPEGSESSTSDEKKWVIPVSVSLGVLGLLGFCICACCCWKKRKAAKEADEETKNENEASNIEVPDEKNGKLDGDESEDEEVTEVVFPPQDV